MYVRSIVHHCRTQQKIVLITSCYHPDNHHSSHDVYYRGGA